MLLKLVEATTFYLITYLANKICKTNAQLNLEFQSLEQKASLLALVLACCLGCPDQENKNKPLSHKCVDVTLTSN